MFKSVRPVSENIVASILYALLILAGGTVLAVLKSIAPNLFSYVLWGLVGSALTAVIVAAWIIFKRIPKLPPETTPENIEANIRRWLDSFQLSVKKVDDENAIFTLVATTDSDMKIAITRLKAFDRYVLLQSAINIAPEDKVRFDALSLDERGRFAASLTVELARSGLGFQMKLDQNIITLDRRVPITSGLTEVSFMEALDHLDRSKIGIHRTLILMLIDLKDKQQALIAPAIGDGN